MRYPKAFFIPLNISRHAIVSPFLGEVARRRRDGEVYFFPGNTFCGGMYEPLRRISKWQWLPVERPVLPR